MLLDRAPSMSRPEATTTTAPATLEPADVVFGQLFAALEHALVSGATLNGESRSHEDEEEEEEEEDAAALHPTWSTCPSGPSRAEARLSLASLDISPAESQSRPRDGLEHDGFPGATTGADTDEATCPDTSAEVRRVRRGGGHVAGAVPARADLHRRWADRLERDEEERHARRVQSLRANVEWLRRKHARFETHVASCLADVELEEAALTSAVAEHVAAAVKRAEALVWECRAEFERAATALDRQADDASTEHAATRVRLTGRAAWESFFRRVGEDLAGDVRVEGAAPGAAAPAQALVDAAGTVGGQLRVERVLSLGYHGQLVGGAASDEAKEAFCGGDAGDRRAKTLPNRRPGSRGAGGGVDRTGKEPTENHPSATWRVHIVHADAPDAVDVALSALRHGLWLAEPPELPGKPAASRSPSRQKASRLATRSTASSPSRGGKTDAGTSVTVSPPPTVSTTAYVHRRVHSTDVRARPDLPPRMLLASKTVAWMRKPLKSIDDDAVGEKEDGGLHVDARVFVCAEAVISAAAGQTVTSHDDGAGEWARNEELRHRAGLSDVGERLWVLPDEEHLVVAARDSSDANGGDAGAFFQAFLARKPPLGPGDLLRRAYLDLDFRGDGGGDGGKGVDPPASFAASPGTCDDVPLHFAAATVGDLSIVAEHVGLLARADATAKIGQRRNLTVMGGEKNRLRLYVLESAVRPFARTDDGNGDEAASRGTAGTGRRDSGESGIRSRLRALDGEEMAELVSAYLYRPGAAIDDREAYEPASGRTSVRFASAFPGDVCLPTARRLWPGGAGQALALVYNEAEAQPVPGQRGVEDAATERGVGTRRARPAFVATCRLASGDAASSSQSGARKLSVSSWIKRQYPPSPLLSRVWNGSPWLLALLEAGELAEVLSELMSEAARTAGGVGSGGGDGSSSDENVATALGAYPRLSHISPPAPRDWSARDFALDEAAAALEDAEEELEAERETRESLGGVLYAAAERGRAPDLRGLLEGLRGGQDWETGVDEEVSDAEVTARRMRVADGVVAALGRNNLAT